MDLPPRSPPPSLFSHVPSAWQRTPGRPSSWLPAENQPRVACEWCSWSARSLRSGSWELALASELAVLVPADRLTESSLLPSLSPTLHPNFLFSTRPLPPSLSARIFFLNIASHIPGGWRKHGVWVFPLCLHHPEVRWLPGLGAVLCV